MQVQKLSISSNSELLKPCRTPEQLQNGTAAEVYRVLIQNSLALKECRERHQGLLLLTKPLFKDASKDKD